MRPREPRRQLDGSRVGGDGRRWVARGVCSSASGIVGSSSARKPCTQRTQRAAAAASRVTTRSRRRRRRATRRIERRAPAHTCACRLRGSEAERDRGKTWARRSRTASRAAAPRCRKARAILLRNRALWVLPGVFSVRHPQLPRFSVAVACGHGTFSGPTELWLFVGFCAGVETTRPRRQNTESFHRVSWWALSPVPSVGGRVV